MCGIFCLIHQHSTTENSYNYTQGELDPPACPHCCSSDNEIISSTKSFLLSRGPDITSSLCQLIPSQNSSNLNFQTSICLTGNVLWTQGKNVVPQPYVYSSKNKSMLFNGDIYSFGSFHNNLEENSNDGLNLFGILNECKNVEDFVKVFKELTGPFAFIYWDKIENIIWFGRDFLGRSSLVLTKFKNESGIKFMISSMSTGDEDDVVEIPAVGIFSYSYFKNQMTLYPWSHPETRELITSHLQNFKKFIQPIIPSSSQFLTSSVSLGKKLILHKLALLDYDDSTLLASLSQIQKNAKNPIQILENVVQVLDFEIKIFIKELKKSIRDRLFIAPNFCKKCVVSLGKCTHAKIGILFSGGVDSMLLACLIGQEIGEGEVIDLINVGFYKNNISELVETPDRKTGEEGFKILENIFKGRRVKFNFIPCNISKDELEKKRKNRISCLISPQNSVLDDSIGCCLWFGGASGSTARVLIVGSGADELLGGYSRHRSAFENKGWEGLSSAMQEDLDRISSRNLGRDNRVLCDHGISLRLPFLAENVVEYLVNLPIWAKCCPIFSERGVGEKLLLRGALFKILGAQNGRVALFPKRAMQFGSRIAKLENGREKGGDICDRLAKNQIKSL